MNCCREAVVLGIELLVFVPYSSFRRTPSDEVARTPQTEKHLSGCRTIVGDIAIAHSLDIRYLDQGPAKATGLIGTHSALA